MKPDEPEDARSRRLAPRSMSSKAIVFTFTGDVTRGRRSFHAANGPVHHANSLTTTVFRRTAQRHVDAPASAMLRARRYVSAVWQCVLRAAPPQRRVRVRPGPLEG